MKTIVSKRRFSKFYLPLIITSFLYFALGSLLVSGAIFSLNEDKSKDNSYFFLVVGFIFYISFIYNIYTYFNNTPLIKLNSKNIYFNNHNYLISEINKINLSGKQPFNHIINLPKEGAELIFNDDKSRYIFDDMYSNTWEIKSFLAEIFEKNKGTSPEHINYISSDDNSLYSFKGHQLLSFTGISFWSLAIFFLYIILAGNSDSFMFLGIVFSLLLLLLICITSFMNYFQILNNDLIIVNHIIFWKKELYNMQNIREIVFEQNGNLPNILRIITHDFKSKTFSATTLSNKKWLDFKHKLEEYDIKVRNESVY
ncbi:hypothetical protein KLP40_10325 [Hymenobacter sp. NST-14]|uniref:hypothetical protein n=1 Tax=Hymenobacter piscis TaxID=2839984 RepID=UPI001C01427A|nr:hypothetical protein [Hymenobacter piscis]MBT9393557.1 hypothetical protein [Hymenobacter piscis]